MKGEVVLVTPQNILVRAPNWIGDQVLAYPFFTYLRKLYPTSRIAVACLPWVDAIQFRDLVDAVYLLPRAGASSFSAHWRAMEAGARLLKEAGPWDLGICLPNSFSSAWIFYRARVKRRRGYRSDGRAFLLTEAIPEAPDALHRADSYLQLLRGLGAESPVPAREFWRKEALNDLDSGSPGVLDVFDAEKAWRLDSVIEPPENPFWVLAPGAVAESRRWPTERFADLSRRIAEAKGWQGVIVGGAAESAVGRQLAGDPSLKLLDFTARGSVTSYVKLFCQAQWTVCNDSGLAHVASLCGSPVHIIWGAGDPKRTEPLGPGRVQISLNPVSCWPCERNSCTQRETGLWLECLRGITVDAVWKEIEAGIGKRN